LASISLANCSAVKTCSLNWCNVFSSCVSFILPYKTKNPGVFNSRASKLDYF
jgi:hypothetical protein